MPAERLFMFQFEVGITHLEFDERHFDMNEELFESELDAGCQAIQEGLDILTQLFCEGCPAEEDDIDFANMQLEIMKSALSDICSSFCF